MSFVALSLILLSFLHRVNSFGPCPDEFVAASYFAGWHGAEGFSVSDISWDKYNTVIYSFAATTPNVSSITLNGSDPSLLPDFVSQAHEHNVAAHIAIGGWSGGRWFSSNVATPENRTAFVQTIVDFVIQFKLDGINFDWEYPNKQGIGCNIVSPNDTANFLHFLQELRAHPVGAILTLAAAVSITPFVDASGNPSTNVTAFADVLDYINIMDYDVWGSWSSTVGPNAPLNDTCAPAADQQGSAVSAVKAWTAAGIPANKIVLNLAMYGHSFSVAPSDAFVQSYGTELELAAYPKFNASNQPLGDAWDNTSGADACGVFQKSGGSFRLWGMVDGGFLDMDGNPAPGIYHRHDECSQTSYVYNKASEVMISYDDAQSITAKAKFIIDAGLKGFAFWETRGDYHDILLNAARSATGLGNSGTYYQKPGRAIKRAHKNRLQF